MPVTPRSRAALLVTRRVLNRRLRSVSSSIKFLVLPWSYACVRYGVPQPMVANNISIRVEPYELLCRLSHSQALNSGNGGPDVPNPRHYYGLYSSKLRPALYSTIMTVRSAGSIKYTCSTFPDPRDLWNRFPAYWVRLSAYFASDHLL